MRTMLAALVSLPLAAAAVPAMGQNNPSTSQIIQSLKPSGNLLQRRHTRNSDWSRRARPHPRRQRQPQRATTAPKPGHAAMQPTPVAAAAPSVNLQVEFPTNSAELTPQARETLDKLGHALTSQDLASYRFRIEGHTDTVGSTAAQPVAFTTTG